MRRLNTAGPTTWSAIFYKAIARREVPEIQGRYPWSLNEATRSALRRHDVTSDVDNLKDKRF
jgi:hypothetical protein